MFQAPRLPSAGAAVASTGAGARTEAGRVRRRRAGRPAGGAAAGGAAASGAAAGGPAAAAGRAAAAAARPRPSPGPRLIARAPALVKRAGQERLENEKPSSPLAAPR